MSRLPARFDEPAQEQLVGAAEVAECKAAIRRGARFFSQIKSRDTHLPTLTSTMASSDGKAPHAA